MNDIKRLYLTESEVNEMLTMDMALEALEEVFQARSDGDVPNEPRYRLAACKGSLNFMAATWP